MARILVGAYVVRYPVGGYLSWTLQWLLGYQRLGHEVYCLEKASWPDSCYDPTRDLMSEDCARGVAVLGRLMERFGLGDRWCFIDAQGRPYGLSRQRVEELFKTCDLFVDMGTNDWEAEAAGARLRVLVDGEPAYTQMKMQIKQTLGEALPSYDFYYTVGANIGTPRSTAPTAGKVWRATFDPVNPDLFAVEPARAHAPFTTVMSWQVHQPIAFNGVGYGQKDVEFAKFMDLPRLSRAPLEVAIAGRNAPTRKLVEAGWRVCDSHMATISLEAFSEYIRGSRGEFSVCKNVFVATNSGAFSDRSAVYLASGRPVVIQDTGFGAVLPIGRGLFAVRTAEEAAAAIDEINADYEHHSRWARELASEHLDARRVVGTLLAEIGI